MIFILDVVHVFNWNHYYNIFVAGYIRPYFKFYLNILIIMLNVKIP